MMQFATQLVLLCGTGLATKLRVHEAETARSAPSYLWAGKNGDALRTGASSAIAPQQLSGGPAWAFHDEAFPTFLAATMPVVKAQFPRMKGLVRATPLIDDQRNIYLSTISTDAIHKFSPDGTLLWKHWHGMNKTLPGIPAIMDGRLFSATADGEVFALDMETGEMVWNNRVAWSIALDTWSIAAGEDMVIIPAITGNTSKDNNRVVALRASDGSRLWKFNTEQPTYNFLPSIKDGSCVFSDWQGRVYRLNLDTGKPIWMTQVSLPGLTTGGAVLGPDGQVYATYNQLTWDGLRLQHEGRVAALRFLDGSTLWNASLDYEANNAPAVGRLHPSQGLSVVIGIGKNPEMPDALRGIAADSGPEKKSRLVVLDAATGKSRWSWELTPWHGAALGDDERPDHCRPEAFTNPAIGGDGTVYFGTQSGMFYSIKDADGDNEITPGEISGYKGDAAYRGAPAVAPGMLVSTPCNGMLVWKL